MKKKKFFYLDIALLGTLAILLLIHYLRFLHVSNRQALSNYFCGNCDFARYFWRS